MYFTVHWHYSGPLEKPHIAYIVSVKGPFYGEIIHFQDSAIGKPSGAKDYSIKLNHPISSSESLYFQVWGSDGSNL